MVGALLQFPLYFITGWWVIPIMIVCAFLWLAGGVKGGNKIFRRIGVPLTVCVCTSLCTNNYIILFAVPFMVWLAPSYGVESWLFKLIKNDFLTRIICFAWYWLAFSLGVAFV